MNTSSKTQATRRSGGPWVVVGSVLLAAASLTGTAALAEENKSWYVGGNIGQSAANLDHERIRTSLGVSGLTVTSIDDDDQYLGYKLFAGYQFNQHFAVESGYFDLGDFSFTAVTVPPGTFTGKIRVRGINVDAVGLWPVSDRFSAFGRIGVTYAEARDTFSGTGLVTVASTNPEERDLQYKFGAGLQYDVTPVLGVRLEAERYRVNDAVGNRGDIDLYSLGIIYRFGADQAKPMRTSAAKK